MIREIYLVPHALTELGEILLEDESNRNASKLKTVANMSTGSGSNLKKVEDIFAHAKSFTDYDFDKPLGRRLAKSRDLIKNIKKESKTSAAAEVPAESVANQEYESEQNLVAMQPKSEQEVVAAPIDNGQQDVMEQPIRRIEEGTTCTTEYYLSESRVQAKATPIILGSSNLKSGGVAHYEMDEDSDYGTASEGEDEIWESEPLAQFRSKDSSRQQEAPGTLQEGEGTDQCVSVDYNSDYTLKFFASDLSTSLQNVFSDYEGKVSRLQEAADSRDESTSTCKHTAPGCYV